MAVIESLSQTPILRLLPDLEVGGALYLNRSQVRSLPPDICVQDTLDLSDTPI